MISCCIDVKLVIDFGTLFVLESDCVLLVFGSQFEFVALLIQSNKFCFSVVAICYWLRICSNWCF